ncbi:MAG: hypothetical protein ACOC93_02185 [Planctomycetota bacterium]
MSDDPTQTDEAVRDCDRNMLRRIVGACEGRQILKPEWLKEQGLPEVLVDEVTTVHRSGRDHKDTIYVDHGVARELLGVHDLVLLQRLCRALSLEDGTPVAGRASGARILRRRILDRLEELDRADEREGTDRP